MITGKHGGKKCKGSDYKHTDCYPLANGVQSVNGSFKGSLKASAVVREQGVLSQQAASAV